MYKKHFFILFRIFVHINWDHIQKREAFFSLKYIDLPYALTLFSRTFCTIDTLFSRTFCLSDTLFSRSFCKSLHFSGGLLANRVTSNMRIYFLKWRENYIFALSEKFRCIMFNEIFSNWIYHFYLLWNGPAHRMLGGRPLLRRRSLSRLSLLCC